MATNPIIVNTEVLLQVLGGCQEMASILKYLYSDFI